MTAAEKLWPKFFVVGYYSHRAVAPCLLQSNRSVEQAVNGAETYVLECMRRHASLASVYGVYVSACHKQWDRIGVCWEAGFDQSLYGEMDRLALPASNFLWTHVAERRGFSEVECYSREQVGGGINPPMLIPERLMRVLHLQWKPGDKHSFLWSPAVCPVPSRATKSKRLVLAREATAELSNFCRERNAFTLSFRHGA
jgi:hypothetical protein